MSDLPNYVVIKDLDAKRPPVLSQVAEEISFPLSGEDLSVIKTLEAKFDAEENCAGLAAPQIGFGKQIIVFAVEPNEELKKWRPDLIQTMPKTIWINPTFEAVGEDTYTDYEGCFSVENLAGPVARYKMIRYSANLINGTKVEGRASGFLARVIQHEIDHLRGQCFIDLVELNELYTIKEYRKLRAQAMEKGRE
jgi:peptide deformylase